jgi:hypothetical protein
MAAPRPLLHLPITAAACTGLYAGSLALVTMLQAQHNTEVARTEAPLVQAVDRAGAERRGAERSMRAASRALDAASGGYSDAAQAALDFNAALTQLAARVEEATGVAARLPSGVRLPSAPAGVAHVSAPATSGTTGASGK